MPRKVFATILTVWLWAILGLCARTSPAQDAGGPRFLVKLSETVAEEPKAGRLFVFLSQRDNQAPMQGPDWFRPEPFYGIDVAEFRPGEVVAVDERADGFPSPTTQLRPGRYRVQAILDFDHEHAKAADGVGNLYSQVYEVEVGPGRDIRLTLDRVVEERAFRGSRWVHEVVVTSKLLSDYHGRDVTQRCAVILPRSYYDEPTRSYPTIYIIPGFSGSHRQAEAYRDGVQPLAENEEEFIRVMLSGQCKWGHHVYANSAANGPQGDALVQELIPYIDANFRTIRHSGARYLNGHSSGGWSSLWLQVNYPDTFGGVWSTAPDPIDFRDFQNVNLYANPPQSLYYDEQDNRRPLARKGGQVLLWYDAFAHMDDVIKRGGQLRSFEAVFSPLGPDGEPLRLWDRETGRIDPEVAQAWQKYDLRLILERNWDTLGPKLQGKLNIFTGSADTFYLEGAVIKMAESLERLGSDAVVEVVPNADHSSLLTVELYRRIRVEMSQAFRNWSNEQAQRRPVPVRQ